MICAQFRTLTAELFTAASWPVKVAVLGTVNITWNDVLFTGSVVISLLLGALLIIPDRHK